MRKLNRFLLIFIVVQTIVLIINISVLIKLFQPKRSDSLGFRRDERVFSDPIMVYVHHQFIHFDFQKAPFESIFTRAIGRLNDYLDISLTNDPTQANICITVTTDTHCIVDIDDTCIRGSTYYSDSPYEFSPGCVAIRGIAVPLDVDDSTVVHELLHAIGLYGHSNQFNDLMYHEGHPGKPLSRADIARLQAIYPPPTNHRTS